MTIDPSARFCSCEQSQNLKDVILFLKANILKNEWVDNGKNGPELSPGTYL